LELYILYSIYRLLKIYIDIYRGEELYIFYIDICGTGRIKLDLLSVLLGNSPASIATFLSTITHFPNKDDS
jgi:hypothetical protein